MGRKSLKPSGFSSFGISAIKALLHPRGRQVVLQNSSTMLYTSFFITSHALLMKLKLKPSAPGAFDESQDATALSISSCELCREGFLLLHVQCLKIQVIKSGPTLVFFLENPLKEFHCLCFNLLWFCDFFIPHQDVFYVIPSSSYGCSSVKETGVFVPFLNPLRARFWAQYISFLFSHCHSCN